MALHISRASDKAITKVIQDRIADGSIVASPPTGETNPGIVMGAPIGLSTVQPKVKTGPATPPVILGKTKSIGDVLKELAARGNAPLSVGKCRVEGCEARGWIQDGDSWLCANHMHSHATRKPFNPADHPLRPSAPPVKQVEDAPKSEPPKPSKPDQTAAPMLMLPAPQIAGLLPSGLAVAALPPAEDTAAPVAIATAVIEFPAHRVSTAPSEREVNPAWIAAFKAAHGLGVNRVEELKALIDGGTPAAYVERVKVVETAAPESAPQTITTPAVEMVDKILPTGEVIRVVRVESVELGVAA